MRSIQARAMSPMPDKGLKAYLSWVANSGDPFAVAVTEQLARYPVPVSVFVTDDNFLGLKNVYPAVIAALEEVYHPMLDGLDHPLRIGTPYREVVLTGGIGCAKTYASVLGCLYGAYLLSCLRNPHALFGLDPNSEIVFLFQSIRFQTGGVAYKLARGIVEGSRFFTQYFQKNHQVKNEILLPNNIVFRPVSGELTAAIGMNVVTVVLDEMSFMRYHAKSVHSEEGGEYDQAKALYSSTRSRIDSRFAKLGRYLIPMWLAGSARHEEDFLQVKIRENLQSIARGEDSGIYVYNKTIWEVKPWDYPSGRTFRVFLGKGSTPAQIVGEDSPLYESEHVIDVPIELEASFVSQPINIALRDICGVPSSEFGNFVVEVEKAKSRFDRRNMFTMDSCTFQGGDLPKVWKTFLETARTDRVWFCHLDLSRTTDCTGMAFGYVDKWVHNRPQMVVEGILEVPPMPGYVVPWDAIIYFIFRASKRIPIYGISADQVGYHYLAEQLPQWGFKIAKISDTPNSEIFHKFLTTLVEGDVSIAHHQKTIDELLALTVDEKTGKVTKPAGGSKDCIDALVGLVELLKIAPRHLHDLGWWPTPHVPEMEKNADGSFRVVGGKPMYALPGA